MFWKQPWDLKAFGKQCKEQWGVTPRPYWAQIKSVTSVLFVKGCGRPDFCLCCDAILSAKHRFLVTLWLAVSCIGLTAVQLFVMMSFNSCMSLQTVTIALYMQCKHRLNAVYVV